MADVTALAPRVIIINHGRLLYDGALGALSARLAPVRRIELALAAEAPPGTLERYGKVLGNHFPKAVLEVPKTTVARVSQGLLSELQVLDLAIQEPPVEEIIRRAFAGEGGEESPGETEGV